MLRFWKVTSVIFKIEKLPVASATLNFESFHSKRFTTKNQEKEGKNARLPLPPSKIELKKKNFQTFNFFLNTVPSLNNLI